MAETALVPVSFHGTVLSTTTSFQRCGCASVRQSDKAVSAIRAIETIDCDQLRDIFNVLTSKMVAAEFCEADLNMMDKVRGFVCGEEEAEMPTFRQFGYAL